MHRLVREAASRRPWTAAIQLGPRTQTLIVSALCMLPPSGIALSHMATSSGGDAGTSQSKQRTSTKKLQQEQNAFSYTAVLNSGYCTHPRRKRRRGTAAESCARPLGSSSSSSSSSPTDNVLTPDEQELKPIVVLIGWLGCSAAHLSKYSDMHNRNGHDCLAVIPGPLTLFLPWVALSTARQLITDVVALQRKYYEQRQQRRKSADASSCVIVADEQRRYNPIILHVMSNNGAYNLASLMSVLSGFTYTTFGGWKAPTSSSSSSLAPVPSSASSSLSSHLHARTQSPQQITHSLCMEHIVDPSTSSSSSSFSSVLTPTPTRPSTPVFDNVDFDFDDMQRMVHSCIAGVIIDSAPSHLTPPVVARGFTGFLSSAAGYGLQYSHPVFTPLIKSAATLARTVLLPVRQQAVHLRWAIEHVLPSFVPQLVLFSHEDDLISSDSIIRMTRAHALQRRRYLERTAATAAMGSKESSYSYFNELYDDYRSYCDDSRRQDYHCDDAGAGVLDSVSDAAVKEIDVFVGNAGARDDAEIQMLAACASHCSCGIDVNNNDGGRTGEAVIDNDNEGVNRSDTAKHSEVMRVSRFIGSGHVSHYRQYPRVFVDEINDFISASLLDYHQRQRRK